MIANDVMTSPAITIRVSASVRDAAALLLKHHVSALPVVDHDGKLVGIVTEGDLMHRTEAGTEARHSWWLRAFLGERPAAIDYVRAHTMKISDLMTKDVVTVHPDTPLNEIAELFESRNIKRVPVLTHGGDLVGIVSRANLVQAIVLAKPALDIPQSDTTIRKRLLDQLESHPWSRPINVTVSNGIVDLWGVVGSDDERKAIRVTAETAPGVLLVNDHLFQRPSEWL